MINQQEGPVTDKFVGRKLELDQFTRAIKPRRPFARTLLGPNANVKPQVFLPYGIGGIGKTELSRRCLKCAENAGWVTIEIDWDRANTRPTNEIQMLNIVAERLKKVYGEKSIEEFLKKEKQIQFVEERVQHLKQENQEKWLSIVDALHDIGGGAGGKQDVDFGSVINGLGKLVNIGADAIARAEDQFSDWLVSTGKLKADDGSLYKRKELFLSSKLVETISTAASNEPLAVLFDTCEVLSPDLEEWLRDVIVCPVIETGKPAMFIISGQHNQYLERQVTLENGKLRMVKGYADRLSDPPPILWNVSRFADPDIANYISRYGLGPKQELLDFIQELARGVPYAVQLVTQALLTEGIEYVKEHFPPKDSKDFSTQEMITLVTQRFLRYCLKGEDDLERVYGLAMMRDWDEGGLSAIWHLPDSESSKHILQTLQGSYSFILPERKLDETVREFIRRELRSTNEKSTREMGKRLASYYSAEWEDFTARVVDLGERLDEPHYWKLSQDLLNALCWQDEALAIKFLVERCIESLFFGFSYIVSLLAVFAEFLIASGWFSNYSHHVVEFLVQRILSKNPMVSGIGEILQEFEFLDTMDFHKGILYAWNAQKQYRSKQYSTALRDLVFAEQFLSNNNDDSIRSILAHLFYSVGWGLGFDEGWQKASQDALTALTHAVKIEPNNGILHIGLGVMECGLGRPQAAIRSISFGIGLEKDKSWAYRWLGSAYYALEETANAIQAYKTAIDLDSKNAEAWIGLGKVHKNMSSFDEAKKYYLKALEIDPENESAQAGIPELLCRQGYVQEAVEVVNKSINLRPSDDESWDTLAYIYRAANRKEDAKAAILKAVEIKGKAAHLNALGNMLADLGELDDAVSAYKKALVSEPDEPYYCDNLANVNLEQQNYLPARDLYLNMIAADSKSIAHVSLAMCYWKMGDEANSTEEQKIAQSLIDIYPIFVRARVEAVNRNVESALKYIGVSLERGTVSIAWVNRDPILDFIRFDSRFKELLNGK